MKENGQRVSELKRGKSAEAGFAQETSLSVLIVMSK